MPTKSLLPFFAIAAFAAGQSSAAENDVAAKRLDGLYPVAGASDYFIGRRGIESQPQGDNRSLDDTLLQSPGVSMGLYGRATLRNESGKLQYRLNGVTLPGGLSPLDPVFDPRAAESVDLIGGVLPAQYGNGAGVVDIRTRMESGVAVGLYGGSFGRLQPSVLAGGSSGKTGFFFSGDYLRSDAAMPRATTDAIHDRGARGRGFVSLLSDLSDETRLSVLLGASAGSFRISNNPGQTSAYTAFGQSVFNSRSLDRRQNEANHFAIVALQGGSGDFDYQIAPFTRYAEAQFTPDLLGGLILTGRADHRRLSSWSSGIQGDFRYALGDAHTLRGGMTFSAERSIAGFATYALPVNGVGAQSSTTPVLVAGQAGKTGYLYGLYLQDERTIGNDVTLNIGARFDALDAFTRENQISPRANLVWKMDADTSLHAGYARNFVASRQGLVMPFSPALLAGTAASPATVANTPVRAEREDVFDAGLLTTIRPGLNAGLDLYYKVKRNPLDEARLGEAALLTPFNYRFGRGYGIEATSSYRNGPLGVYLNAAYGQAKATGIVSGQYLFTPAEIAYVQTHTIAMGQSQNWTVSGGASLTLNDTWGRLNTAFDILYGSGLRRSAGAPNDAALGGYAQFNVGAAQSFDDAGALSGLSVRVDIINLFDDEIRLGDGSMLGGGSPQLAMGRAFYAGIGKSF